MINVCVWVVLVNAAPINWSHQSIQVSVSTKQDQLVQDDLVFSVSVTVHAANTWFNVTRMSSIVSLKAYGSQLDEMGRLTRKSE